MSAAVAWIALVGTIAQLGQPVHQYAAENPACQDPVTVAPLCDEAFRLFETGVRVENERDTCRIEAKALEAKLQNHSIPPPPTVVIEEKVPTWLMVVGSIAVALAFVGGAYAGVQVSK